MDYQSMFTFMLEMAGTIAFAASGAMVGAQRGMDIFGVCVLGVVTAVGGGATRDIILGIVPPGMFQDPLYTIVATVTSCIVFAVMYWKQELLEGGNRLVYDKVMLVMDTVGLGVFTVMGVDKGISQGYMGRTFFLVFLGTVTGVGGGVQKGAPTYYRGVEVDMNLRPKVKIEIVVSLVPVQKVIDTAKEVLHTGQIGDGKVFVYDIENVVKIRTGEEGFLALQDTDA